LVLNRSSSDLTEATQVIAAAPPGGRNPRSWLLAACVLVVAGVVGVLLAVRHNSLRSQVPATPPASTVRAEPRTVTVAPADAPAARRRASPSVAVLTVPDVQGEKFADARQRLRDAGLVAEVSRVSSELPKQTVVEQSPATGATAVRGDHVLLTVSLGAKKDKGNDHDRGRHKHEKE
jgi:PASTA domain